MKWEDTVLGADERRKAGGWNPLKQAYVTGIDILNIEQNLCKAQAEISFKAGQRSVVEWIEMHKLRGVGAYSTEIFTEGDIPICKDWWRAQKKEWGI